MSSEASLHRLKRLFSFYSLKLKAMAVLNNDTKETLKLVGFPVIWAIICSTDKRTLQTTLRRGSGIFLS